jgi:hypothetical protein
MGAVRYSRALVTAAISSVALFGLVILSLSAGLVREPWDLMVLVGVSRWPIALGAFIPVALFACGLWTVTHLH